MNTIEDRTLEALVDGELGEVERAALLRELDGSPDGWRRLGLAFLADQAMRQTLLSAQGGMLSRPRNDLALSQATDGPRKHGTPSSAVARRHSLRPWAVGITACAACALLAFCLGVWAVPAREIVVQAPVPSGADLARAVEEPRALEGPTMPTLTLAARKELERRGFVVHERPRVVPVLHQDGRTIKVLVNEIEVRYVGRQSIL